MPDYMAMNATYASMSNSASLNGVILMILIIMIGCGILIYGLSALERYKRIWGAIGWYLKTLMYTAYGIVLCGVLGGIYLICTYVASAASSVDPFFVINIIAGYIGVTILGYVCVLVYRKVRDQHAEMKKSEQPQTFDAV